MSHISYNPQINILTQIIKDIEVVYSIEKRENTICIDLNIESIMNQLDSKLSKFSSIYKEHTGSTYLSSTDTGNNVNTSPIRIYLADKFIEIKRELKEEIRLVSNVYKIQKQKG